MELPIRITKRRGGFGVSELLKVFGIESVADVSANSVSGGEAQRTAIVRAMANRPRIILADESRGNLDEENTEEVISML